MGSQWLMLAMVVERFVGRISGRDHEVVRSRPPYLGGVGQKAPGLWPEMRPQSKNPCSSDIKQPDRPRRTPPSVTRSRSYLDRCLQSSKQWDFCANGVLGMESLMGWDKEKAGNDSEGTGDMASIMHAGSASAKIQLPSPAWNPAIGFTICSRRV